MSKIKLLLDVVSDLRSLAESVAALAEVMAGNEPVEATQAETTAPEKVEKSKPKMVTLEQVRAVLAEKSQDGYTAEVRGLLEKHGAQKLSQIDKANYASLLADAEELGNG